MEFLELLAPARNADIGIAAIDCGADAALTELKISQLGKQIRYIPLETTDSSLIGNSYSIKPSKARIFVSTIGRCLSFDQQTGKYLGSIGHKGEDPKGYSNPKITQITDSTKSVTIMLRSVEIRV